MDFEKSQQQDSPKLRNTRFLDDFSAEIFDSTYRFSEEQDINERHYAIARDIAQAEVPALREYWTDKFLDLLENFTFVPGGRITSNAGTGLDGTTYINCFVSGFRGTHQDSMNSIMDELRRQALILKSEGGYGFCIDVLRPRGAYIEGIGGYSPGSVRLLDMWDTQSAVITAGSGMKRKLEKRKLEKGKKKMRKGAQMVTLSVWHPDIEEFITAKQAPARLTKFNMSVLVTDEFMKAVEQHTPWTLEFPDHEQVKSQYDEQWDGNIKKWKDSGLPVKIYKTYLDANELWDLIMNSTYHRNEPGVLFYDTMNRLNNLYYLEHINATNPCGEQILPVGGCCLLGSLNLTQFVDPQKQDWDFDKLKKIIPMAIRFMDNVNDRTQVPLPEQKENLTNKRRIGLGILGYGSALMMMKIRYGSPQALEITQKLGAFIMNEAYRSSALLASEKGRFPAFDKAKYLAGEFVKNLASDVRDLIAQHGLRNSHLLSIQPTGNSSVLANNVSGGLEPIFMPEYTRTVIQAFVPEGLTLPTNIDWQKPTCRQGDTEWQWIQEGDENLLKTEWQGHIYKIDQNRGLLKEFHVCDYAVRFHKEQGTWDSRADWAATTYQLNIDDHIETMKVLSRFIDSAMSKTVNISENYPFEDFKRLYKEVYKTGTIKGCTSYREGTMATVLAASSSTQDVAFHSIPRTKAPPRPQLLDCDIHQIKSEGQKWVVLVGLLGRDPYEVFAMKSSGLSLPAHLNKGRLVKKGSGQYNLETADGWILSDVRQFFASDEHEALTRMISTALRHGVDIEFIVSQLLKSEGTINSFAKAIARTLKSYITEIKTLRCSVCQSHNLKLQEGCFVCQDCGMSRCE